MARTQVDYQPNAELTQVRASPNIQGEHVQAPDPRNNSAVQLAEALGVALPVVAKEYIDVEQKKATRHANSMTVDELHQKVKDGSILESQSATYVATVRHIYGENGLKKLQDDATSAMATGKLKFNTNEELDQYLTGKRNEFLKGQDKYTIAGFDKKWNQFRDGAIDTHTKVLNEQFVSRGMEEAAQAFQNDLATVTSADYKGTPEEAAGALVSRYKQFTQVSILRDDKRKEALTGLATEIATSGNKELLNAFLHQSLDNGINVNGVLGQKNVAALAHHTEVAFDKKKREQWEIAREPYFKLATEGALVGSARADFERLIKEQFQGTVTPEAVQAILDRNDRVLEQQEKAAAKAQAIFTAERSIAAAEQQVKAKLEAGVFFAGAGKPVTYVDEHGNTRELNQKDVAEAYLRENTHKYTFPQLVTQYSTNGILNPDWQKVITTGASNIASVGWKFDGKNVGVLNEQGRAAIETYLQLHAADPAAAAKHAGDNAKIMGKIALLTGKSLNYGIDEAVSLINQAEHSGVTDETVGKLTSKLPSTAEEIMNPHWWSGISRFFGGAENVNPMPIDAEAKELTKLLLKTGQFTDAKAAYEVVMKQMSDPKVTTVINGTIYHNKDLPALPEAVDRKEYMEAFIKDVPGQLATAKQFSAGDVRLHPRPDGAFLAMVGNVPLLDANGRITVYSADQIQKWGGERFEAESIARRQTGDFNVFYERMQRELKQNTKGNKYFLERFDPHAGTPIFNKQIMSREGYDKLRAEGLDKKPLAEIMQTLKERRK